MLLRFQSQQYRGIYLKIIVGAALFPVMLFAQTSGGEAWPSAAAGANRLRAPDFRMEVPKSRQPGRSLWIASVAALAVANVADAGSSWNKYDSNRTLAGAHGKFGGRGALIKGGVNSLWVAGQFVAVRKNPSHRRFLAIVNLAAASVFAVAAYRNYGIAAPGGGR